MAAGRIVRGLCARCGKEPLTSETLCTACREYHKGTEGRRRARNAEQGLCVICGQVAPEPGKLRCADCGEFGNAMNVRFVAARTKAGLCTRCGGGPLETKLMCASCAAKARLTANARSHGLTVEAYVALLEHGCWICGSKEDLHVDHDHSCCDYVRNGYHRSRSCAKCTRKALCGRHNTIVAGLEHKEAMAALRYLLEVGSAGPLVAYAAELTRSP